MDRLDAMALLVAAIDEGSLAAAARKLGRSPATVTRAVAILEARLGERLLHRTTRRMKPTPFGERQAAVYRGVLAELAEAEAGARSGRLEGTIALTAPELFGRLELMPVLEAFLAEHDGVRARVLFLNRVVDLVEEGIDLAVRLAPLRDSAIRAVRLGEVRPLLCASPDYLARHGAPETPAGLRDHVCIGAEEASAHMLWRFSAPGEARSRVLSVAIRPRIALSGAGAAIDSALRGSGICRSFSYQVADHLAAGRLVALLPAFEPAPVPVTLLFHPIPHRNATLRAFVDFATPRLRQRLSTIAEGMARRG